MNAKKSIESTVLPTWLAETEHCPADGEQERYIVLGSYTTDLHLATSLNPAVNYPTVRHKYVLCAHVVHAQALLPKHFVTPVFPPCFDPVGGTEAGINWFAPVGSLNGREYHVHMENFGGLLVHTVSLALARSEYPSVTWRVSQRVRLPYLYGIVDGAVIAVVRGIVDHI